MTQASFPFDSTAACQIAFGLLLVTSVTTATNIVIVLQANDRDTFRVTPHLPKTVPNGPADNLAISPTCNKRNGS